MKSVRLVLFCVVVLGLGTWRVQAQNYDFTFTAEQSLEWNCEVNWWPIGRPGPTDSVKIPWNKTCICADPEYGYRAESIYLEAYDQDNYATLTIDGATLTVGNQNLTTNTSEIDGVLRFEGDGPVLCFIIKTVGGTFELSGSGTITASHNDGCDAGIITHWHSHDT